MNDEHNENTDKLDKKFQAVITKLVAVVGGKEKLRLPKKVGNDQVAELVRELFKDEEEALLLQVKNDLRETLKKYAEMEKAFRDKEQELEKLKAEKKKDFVKTVEGLFNKIENIGTIEATYYQGLAEAITPTETSVK